ncbi:TlpA family protein disulfide reductase [Larkinella punicea]|uniref:TlpA family protein disulfide reductase n=2 Tax=Larkinella punicea TaxID=2315727 RepID=A0A368JSJ8_9BACT|nr:TlpA family protein disulfide reductase [Larkinella punicea]
MIDNQYVTTMKWSLVFGIVLVSLLTISCSQNKRYGNPVAEPAILLKDITSFLAYREKNVKLSDDYQALDTLANPMTQESFLKSISTGRYFPLRLKSDDSTAVYQLSKLEDAVSQDIKTTVKYWGLEELEHFQKEGTALPAYQFTDLEGNVYTNQSTKGKIVVLKCWFIACLPCVQEMPALNELKSHYKNRPDVLFLSLCLDPRQKVAAFLKKKQFDYAVIPDQESYLTDQLQINAYPTHFVINKQGLITKKVTDYHALVYALKKETAQ